MIHDIASARDDGRIDPADMRRIRAAEMYCMELEGVHMDDISRIFKVTRSHVYAEIRGIPDDVRPLIEASEMRDRIGAILRMVRNRPGGAEEVAQQQRRRANRTIPTTGSEERKARARRLRDQARRAQAREMRRRKNQGEPIEQIAADFETSVARVNRAIWELSMRGKPKGS